MPEVKVGDRVRITFEGEVTSVKPWDVGDVSVGTKMRVTRDDGRTVPVNLRHQTPVQVEVIEPPEKYEDGAVYVDADQDVFQYVEDEEGWLGIGTDHVFSFDYATRPLVKLPVASQS